MEQIEPSFSIHIVSFEKEKDRADGKRMSQMRARLASAGIGWTPLAYHKTPTVPATLYDIAQGVAVVTWLTLRRRVAILHARSYVAAVMAMIAKRLTGAKFLFDIRGFWADERVDGGLWTKDGRLYRAVKGIESLLIANADHMVTLTHASARELENWPAYAAHRPPLTVIPTCADLARFSPQTPPAAEPFVFGYVGSIGTWYLFDETVEFFEALARRRPDARMLAVNRNDHAAIRETFMRHGVAEDRFEVVAAEHREVPAQIARMHVAAAIVKPAYSKIASAPTKLAEYLGCGVPCLGNVGVGDMEQVLEGRRVGVALREFSTTSHAAAAERLLALLEDPEVRARCVATAHELFSLDTGVKAYRSIYVSLSQETLQTSAGRVARE
jgi:glycosyltransferase involved in cell wall biosynthesis